MTFREPPPNTPLLLFGDNVVAVDRATGNTVWEYSTSRQNVRRFAMDGERLFVIDAESILHCIELSNGKPLGKIDLGLSYTLNMLIDDGRLYVFADKNVVALDLEGRILWRQTVSISGAGFSLMGMAVPGGNSIQPDFSHR